MSIRSLEDICDAWAVMHLHTVQNPQDSLEIRQRYRPEQSKTRQEEEIVRQQQQAARLSDM